MNATTTSRTEKLDAGLERLAQTHGIEGLLAAMARLASRMADRVGEVEAWVDDAVRLDEVAGLCSQAAEVAKGL